ncbi:hypothetical protein J43TS9_31810 [Paenibacillus cineris]|nr:hypothetical protein J43TS9_31810 [Paenibacillus cineris]
MIYKITSFMANGPKCQWNRLHFLGELGGLPSVRVPDKPPYQISFRDLFNRVTPQHESENPVC